MLIAPVFHIAFYKISLRLGTGQSVGLLELARIVRALYAIFHQDPVKSVLILNLHALYVYSGFQHVVLRGLAYALDTLFVELPFNLAGLPHD